MERKNLSNLIDAIQAISPDARENIEQFTRAFFQTIAKGLESDRIVKIKGFGTFKVIDVSPRESIDVNSGKRIEINGHSKITFTPDTYVKEAVNKPFVHLQSVVINEGTDISLLEKVGSDNAAPEPYEPTRENGIIEEEPADADNNPEETGDDNAPEPAEEPAEEIPEEASCEIQEEPAEEAEENNTIDEPTEEPTEYSHKSSRLTCIISTAIAAVVFFALGFFTAKTNFGDLAKTSAPGSTPTIQKSSTASKAPQTAKKELQKSQASPAPGKESIKPLKPIMPIQTGDKYMIVGQQGSHILGKGENITRLAKKTYGDKDCVKYIIRFNDIKDPDLISVGAELKLPELVPIDF